MEFEGEYQALMDRLLAIYDALRENKGKSTRNNQKLQNYDKEALALSREIDRLREKYKEQYKIYELIEGVQSTHKFIVEDIGQIYKKPRPENLIPNFRANKPRRSSFSAFERLRNRFKKFTQRRRTSFGGKGLNKTKKH